MEFSQEAKLEDVLESWLAIQKKEETVRAYRREVQGLLKKSSLQQKSVLELSQIQPHKLCELVFKYLAECLHLEPDSGTPKNPNTWNRRKFILQSFFKHLRRYHGFYFCPPEFMDPLPVEGKSNTTPLSKEEMLNFLTFMKEESARGEAQRRDFLLVLSMLIFCLRRKEAANLRWSQIDTAEKKLTTLQKGSRYKINPIDVDFLRMLLEFKEQYGEHGPFIFRALRDRRSGKAHKAVSPEYVYKLVTSVAKRIVPGKKITPHSFRTTFITLGLDTSPDLVRILNASGHSKIEMVIYYDLRNRLRVNFSNEMVEIIKANKII